MDRSFFIEPSFENYTILCQVKNEIEELVFNLRKLGHEKIWISPRCEVFTSEDGFEDTVYSWRVFWIDHPAVNSEWTYVPAEEWLDGYHAHEETA